MPSKTNLRALGALLACALAPAAVASEPTPFYYHVLRSLPQPVRDAERPITADVFIATRLTSKAGPAVRVDRFEFLGASVVPAADLQAATAASAGKTLTPAQIDEAAEAVAKLYRSRGYPLAMAALVDVQGGVARIQLYEGRLGAVRVEGDSNYAEEALVQPFLDLPTDAPLTAAQLETAARTLDDYPGLVAQVQPLPGKTAGVTDLVLKVSARTLGFSVAADNDGIESVGRQRYQASLRWNSPSGWGDELGLTVMNTDMGGLQYARLDYSLPIDAAGLRAELSYAMSEYESSGLVDGTLGPYTAFGDTSDLRIGVSSAHRRTRGLSQVTSYWVQRVEGSNYALGAPVVFAPPYSGSAITTFGVGWYRGRDLAGGLGDALRVEFETNAKHNDGTEGDALLGQFRISYENLSGDGARVYSRFRGAYTVSSAPLLKRFQIGGPDSVRAYDRSAYEGDSGFDATVEGRFGGVGKSGLRREFVTFLDAGYVASNEASVVPSGQVEGPLLGAFGLGLRFASSTFRFGIEYAYPLGQHSTADGDDNGYFWGRLSVDLD